MIRFAAVFRALAIAGALLWSALPASAQFNGGRVGFVNEWALPGASVDADLANNRYLNGFGPAAILSVTRAQTVTSYATTSAGVLVPFAANTLRITDQGLLVEEARTNLALQSNTVSTSPWSYSGNVGAGTPGTFLDGTPFGQLLASGTNANRVVQPVTIANASTYSYSAFFQAGNSNGFIRWQTATTTQQWKLNLSTGAVTAGPGNTGNTGSVTLSRQGTSNVWRATITILSDATSVSLIGGLWDGSADQFGYPGSLTGATVYFGGAQLELGPFPTSYIPTTSASVTRAADNVTAAGALLATLQGTAFSIAGYALQGTPNQITPRIIGFSSSNSPLQLGGGGQNRVSTWNASVELDATLPSGTIASSVKAASAFNSSGRSIVANGGTVATDAGTMPATTSVNIGSNAGTGSFLDSYLTRLTAFNSRLPDATLKAQTVP
jgi:hypothetical protein